MSAQNVKWPRSSVSRLVSSIVFYLIIGVSKEIGRKEERQRWREIWKDRRAR